MTEKETKPVKEKKETEFTVVDIPTQTTKVLRSKSGEILYLEDQLARILNDLAEIKRGLL